MATRKKTYIDFTSILPAGGMAKATGLAAAVTDNTTNVFMAGDTALEVRNEQQNDDVTFTYLVDANCTTGWQIPNDNADNDGGEISLGIESSPNAKHAFTIGTDPAFELRVKLGIPDVSDYDVLFVGFRIAGAYVDAINTPAAMEAAYTDKAGFSIEAGDIHILTSNDNSDVDTDVTASWADDAVKTLTVKVSSAGAVTYQIDGTAVSDAVAFSFDSTDVVVPCIVFCKGAAAADTPPILNYLYVGYSE